jgi:hypothetical protein
MKNLFRSLLLVSLLFAAGCATKDPNHPAETADWQYRTFPISASNEGDFRSQLNTLRLQGWSYVSTSNSTQTPGTAVQLVLMRRPNR